LIINAVAPDGIIEGVEMLEKQFCLGVQWHPEFFAVSNNANFNLFKSLVSKSKE
jgi:putative glutamine amidotransferase